MNTNRRSALHITLYCNFLLLKSNSQTLMNIDEKYLPKCTNSGFFKAMLENCFQLS